MQSLRFALWRNLVRLQAQQCVKMHRSFSSALISRCSSVVQADRSLPALQLPTVNQSRSYAKKVKKEKKDKAGKKGSKPKVELSEEELHSAINFDKFEQQMRLALDTLKQEYMEQLTIRSTAGALDHLSVETPDGKFHLIQLAQIAQKNPQLVVVNMATAPQYIGEVKNAIMSSGMNLNPQQDGTTLFVPMPKVTREHREQLSKNAKTLCDKTKDKLRDTQNRFVKDLKKKKGTLSEDLIHNVQETLQSSYATYCAEAEFIMLSKQKELLGNK